MDSEPYIIIYGDNILTLRRKVNEWIRQGYNPQGGLCIVPESFGKEPHIGAPPKVTEYRYYQAMLKIEEATFTV